MPNYDSKLTKNFSRHVNLSALEGIAFVKTLAHSDCNVDEVEFYDIVIEDEEMAVIAWSLTTNQSVLYLKLYQCSFSLQAAKELGIGLQHNRCIRKLTLYHCGFGVDMLIALAKALRINQVINELDLSYNKFGDEWVFIIAEVFKSNSTISVLDLSHNAIGPKGATALAEGLSCNASIAFLNLSDNSFGDKGIAVFASMLCSQTNGVITTLCLRRNKFGPLGARVLADALSMSTCCIETLNLSENRILDEGAAALANALIVNRSLQWLNVSECEIGASGASALFNALARQEFLTDLDLGHNNICLEGAKALANALMVNTALRTVDLFMTKIDDAGSCTIANALKSNRTVMHLNLGANCIESMGAKALAQALAVAESKIAFLSLNYTDIGDEGAIALANALSINRSVNGLCLCKTFVSNDVACAFGKMLAKNSALSILNLDCNYDIDGLGRKALLRGARHNKCLSMLVCDESDSGSEDVGAYNKCLDINHTLYLVGGIDMYNRSVNEKLRRNMERQLQLVQVIKRGDMATLKHLLSVGVSKAFLHDGLTVFHMCLDLGRWDMLELLLEDNVGHGITETYKLKPGRMAAHSEIARAKLEQKLICFFCIWAFRKNDCGILRLLPHDVMKLIAKSAIQSIHVPYLARKCRKRAVHDDENWMTSF
jgi:Ran GTPase-activating protein (RanGAP) involved in mRNA processing and transport